MPRPGHYQQSRLRLQAAHPLQHAPRFDDVVDGHRKRMREVAILELEGDRVAALREYWASERVSS